MRDHGENAERIRALNGQVTTAIIYAEHLTPESPEAIRAFADVSRIEEALASLLPYDCAEGIAARTGAITAAIDAQDFTRAKLLIERYRSGAPEDVMAALDSLDEENRSRFG